MIKDICSQVTSPAEANCGNAITLDPKTKCTFVSGGTSCSIVNKKCTEITEDASIEICESVVMEGDNGCKYDSENKKCAESLKCLNLESITTEDECTSAPTSDYITKKCVMKTVDGAKRCAEETKTCSEIKNGATSKICIDAPVSDSTKKKCELNSSKEGECIEKDIIDTTKESPADDNSNGNNGEIIKLSFPLIGLLLL